MSRDRDERTLVREMKSLVQRLLDTAEEFCRARARRTGGDVSPQAVLAYALTFVQAEQVNRQSPPSRRISP